MIINSITTAGVAASVWNNATRSLTADPATTAVAGVNVWATATRTITADPFTDAVGGAAVWTHAARTVTADPATDAGAATLVWARATRVLTSLGAGTQATVSSIHQSLAASATVDLRPAAGKFRDIVLVCETVAAASLQSGLYDGTTARLGAATASGAPGTFTLKGTSTFGPCCFNNSGNSSFYNIAGIDWVQ